MYSVVAEKKLMELNLKIGLVGYGEKLKPVGFDMTVVSEKIGVASAMKLCRSVFIKGLEAIVVESYTLARRHGVEQQLLASLAKTFPEIDWEK